MSGTQGKAGTPRQVTADSLYNGLSPAERDMAARLVQETLETVLSQQTRRWQYNGTGNGGFVTPLRTFRIKTGHYCREYMETVSTRQGLNSSIFTACRDGAAVWRIVER